MFSSIAGPNVRFNVRHRLVPDTFLVHSSGKDGTQQQPSQAQPTKQILKKSNKYLFVLLFYVKLFHYVSLSPHLR